MCFSSKSKQPKVSPESIAAPAPVLQEPPKGVEFGDGTDTDVKETTDGLDDLKVTKGDQGDGTQAAPVSTDTGTSTVSKSKKSTSIKRALKR